MRQHEAKLLELDVCERQEAVLHLGDHLGGDREPTLGEEIVGLVDTSLFGLIFF